MNTPPNRHSHESRMPLTITLEPASYDFVKSCATHKQFRSVDELFEAALTIYKHHLEALMAYIELQQSKGMTLNEIMRNIDYEIVFTRRKE